MFTTVLGADESRFHVGESQLHEQHEDGCDQQPCGVDRRGEVVKNLRRFLR
jgi:hypothetical protein